MRLGELAREEAAAGEEGGDREGRVCHECGQEEGDTVGRAEAGIC